MNLHDAFQKTMDYEGGGLYHEVPGDPGMGTKWGISSRSYPELDVENLDEQTARDIFQSFYWDKVQADNLPARIRWDVVDFAFNAGIGVAARTLQRSVNLCMESQGRHDFLRLDGQVGPKTLFLADEIQADRLLRVFRAYRASYYLSLAKRRHMSKFIHGWLKRAEGIHG